MTQREINRMSEHESRQLLRGIALELDRALNLFGVDSEPISDLLGPLTEREMETKLDEILAPECNCRRGDSRCELAGHGFPPWFCERARPIANRFARTWKQIAKSPRRM